ncbi:hypothetical protein JQ616_17535 [Bradyrhizobium tropiciagri]|uniref:PEP-utilizing enzyme n=1 Tax=Bradyrhizobium tropiciagri TaxID=312253 RepID=UPI001BA4BA4A|nr:PEP-utilizing enzyme [Bradyrhizobium tropiciagri]MBR0896769.1 hypothetical protein [Bradyrhizobium tropiciagri]
MPTIIPVDEFVSADWYPGFKPEYLSAPFYFEAPRPFRKEDEKRFWFVDFHWPSGFCPLGTVYLEDCYAWGTQFAAASLPLPPGNGLVPRLAGIHAYGSEAIGPSPYEIQQRAMRIAKTLPPFLKNFPQIWADCVEELESGSRYFEAYDTNGKTLVELGQFLIDARSFHKRAWEIHFGIMYPLLANYLGFYGLCGELKIAPGEIAKFLQGYDTKMMECDRVLWQLAKAARGTPVGAKIASVPVERLEQSLRTDPASAGWVKQFDAMIATYGMRTEGIADPMLAPWSENAVPALGSIKSFLAKGKDFDFDASAAASAEERQTAVDRARGRLTRSEQEAFDGALASCQQANFPWWNEDHNYYIDLRATVPLRKAALAIGAALETERPDDCLFSFHAELAAVARGDLAWSAVRQTCRDRRDYYNHWLARRGKMPKVLGTVPDEVMDPVMIEIFGIHHHFLSAVRGDGARTTELTGVAASAGRSRGVARVLHDAANLHLVEPGEILICEGTTPSWTPAFTKIAGCVCDGGGTLTHASIISREYRVPCVVGVGVGTTVVKTGDVIEVDGDTGTVRIISSVAPLAAE